MILPVPVLIVRPSLQIDLSKVNTLIHDLGYMPDMVLYADHPHAASLIIEEHLPNLIIYLIEKKSDLDFIAQLKQNLDHNHFIAVIVTASSPLIYSALRSGIDSYILEEHPITEMLETLKIALRGGAYLHTDLAHYLLEQIEIDPTLKSKINTNEQQLLSLFSQNLSIQDTLKSLQLHDFQVHHMIRKIYKKISH